MQGIKIGAFALGALVFIGALYGAIPGHGLPTLGQALWTSGFAQSFANESILSIHATNFGIPQPAPIAFGLSGAWLNAAFIRMGIRPADAYSLMYLVWLCVSFSAAYLLARRFNATPLHSYLASILWLSMPIIWANSGFSMLALGFALLPLYILVSLQLFLPSTISYGRSLRTGAVYMFSVLVAVFMDGYSFMMFALASSVICGGAVLLCGESRIRILTRGLPLHVAAFSIAYVLYISYIGKAGFENHAIEYFRGAGLDLSYVVVPSRGQHWILDLLGWSIPRDSGTFYGHFSSWTSTFSIPILAVGLLAWWLLRGRMKFASGVLFVLLLSFYFSLGPSLKIDSHRIESDAKFKGLPYMSAEAAVAPTGSAWIYENIPGFSQMRVTFRWAALTVCCAWLLFVIFLGAYGRQKKTAVAMLTVLLAALNLPNVPDRVERSISARQMFVAIENELISPLQSMIRTNERIMFVPFRNDWMINYVSAKAQIRSFNIGGDKNLRLATQAWPAAIRALRYGEIDYSQTVQILENGDADVVVITYFNSLTSSFNWPCTRNTKCPDDYREEYADLVKSFAANDHFAVEESDLFALVRPRNALSVR